VTVRVVAATRGPKLIVYKYKAKKRYRRTQGARAEQSLLEVLTVKGPGSKAKTAKATAARETKAADTETEAAKPAKAAAPKAVADKPAKAEAKPAEVEVKPTTAEKPAKAESE
jgi:large subunit ribosomal protein L21